MTDFVELYGRVRAERPGEVDIGSSAFADVDPDRVRIHAADLDATAALGTARDPLRRLVGRIFEAKDEYGDGHQRDAALEAMQETLADRGIDVDVRTLYTSLVDA